MQIISKDTTWAAGQVINLTDDVQVAPGVTLTIAPGAQITGGYWSIPNGPTMPSYHNIQVYGTLKAQGAAGSEILFSKVPIQLSDNSKYSGSLFLDHTQIDGAAISRPTGNGAYGSFTLTNSIISNAVDNVASNYWYAWYPLGTNKISGNIFLAEQPISLGIWTGSIEISNNIFDNYKGGAITNWAAYGPAPILSNNAYLMVGKPTLSLEYNNSKLISSGDYFGGATQDQLNSMIYDGNDTFSISDTIALQNIRSTPSPTLPTDMFTFTSIDMPSEIVKTARILGNSDVTLNGNKLDNIITVNRGNDTINGGGGINTVVLSGKLADYTITTDGSGKYTVIDAVTGRDGTETLTNIQFLTFSDANKAIVDIAIKTGPGQPTLTAPATVNLVANSTTSIQNWFTALPAKGGSSIDLYVFYEHGSGPNTGHVHVTNGYILQNNVWLVFSGDVPQQTVVAVSAADFSQVTYTAPKIVGLHDDIYAGVAANGQWSSITHTVINT